MKRAGSVLSLSHSEPAESLAVLFEISGRVAVDFVLLQKGVHLHSRFEAKQPPKLRCGKRVRPVCFQRQALERGARQVLPLDSGSSAMSSGSSNLICIGERPSTHYLYMYALSSVTRRRKSTRLTRVSLPSSRQGTAPRIRSMTSIAPLRHGSGGPCAQSAGGHNGPSRRLFAEIRPSGRRLPAS